MKPTGETKPNTDKNGNSITDQPKEPAIPLSTFVPIARWLAYSVAFFLLLTPFEHTVGQWICGALILGWFAGMLNAIINKK